MIHVKKDITYFINERALLFSENDLDDPQRVSVSLVSGTVIMVHVPGVIDYASDGNYERWNLKGYSTKLVSNEPHFVYARLSRNDRTALIVFSVKDYNVEGGVTTVVGKDENGNDITETSEPSADYFYIRIGTLTGTDGKTERDLTYDSGLLGTKKGDEESTGINEMWELSKLSTPWLIRAKQWLAGFTVKGFITLVGGLVFRKGETEKPVTDIKRSFDPEEDVPVSDENVTTSQYVESRLELLDERFLSKIKPDETPHHIKLLNGLTTTHAESTDYAEGAVKGGWAVRKDIDDFWYAEADKLVARVMAKVYDLLVERNAVFKGPLSSSEFISGFVGGKGWAIRLQEYINAAGETEQRSIAEFDDLIVRGTMRVFEFVVNQLLGENDNRIFTGMMEVDHYDAGEGILYLSTNGGKLYNPFRADDIIIVQQYGGMPSEDNDYYVAKQYEFLVTEVGVGDMSAGEDRLDWLKFTNFSSPMEGADMTLITKGDTLVRIDNLYDMRRKGIVQIMSVGEDTPYMDMVYGAKTDPENCVKGRLGNLGGIYNPLFGWLREFGAYLINLYTVGEFRIAHTGEDVADAIDIAKGSFRTNYRQTTYDMTEEDNFLTNAAMTNDCEGWTLVSEDNSYFTVGDDVQFFNYEPLGSEESYAGISELHGRDMLRLSNASAMQENALIRKPGTHKVFTSTTENEDGTITKNYDEVPDTLYLSVRVYCEASGDFEFGFADADGTFHENAFHHKRTLEEGIDGVPILLEGVWDGTGNFLVKSSGDMYIDLLSLTDRPLDNYRIETSTSIEQDAQRISLLGKKVNGVEGSITKLGIEMDTMEERITTYVEKEIVGVEASVSKLQVGVDGISASVSSAQGSADQANSAAAAAKQAADDAAAKALAAQSTADTANSKADANATYIGQTKDSISMMAGAFTFKDGKAILTSSAGAVITAESASLYATKTTVDSLTGRVSTAEAKITTNATNIELKVSKNGVISSINQSSESVTINASKINFNGVVTANGTFQIDTSGYMTCIGGTIGGFTIESGALKISNPAPVPGYSIGMDMELSASGITQTTYYGLLTRVHLGVDTFNIGDVTYYGMINVTSEDSDFSDYKVCGIRLVVENNDLGLYINGGSTHILSSGVTKLHGLVLNQRWVSTTSILLANDDIIMFNNTSAITVSLDNTVPVGKVYYLKRTTNYNVELKGQLRGSPYIDIQNTTVPLDWASYMVIHTDTAWTIYYCGKK